MRATLRLRLDEIAKYRVRAGLRTEQDLADAMRASQATVNRVLNGRQQPGPEFIASLVSSLEKQGATFYDLFEIAHEDDEVTAA